MNSTKIDIAEFASRFKNPVPKGKGFEVRCPCHDDRTNSVSINSGDDGRILIHCHAKCATQDIVAAIGLKMSDLMPASNGNGNGKSHIVATYDYKSAEGELLYQVVRFDPKDFRQRRPDGNGNWVWKINGIPRVLYHLPELLSADRSKPVFIPEGEKDVDRLANLGFIATCNVGGAGKWKPEYSDALADRHVVILPDNDEAGREHAQEVAALSRDKAASVRILELPELPPKNDVSDWLANGGTADELMRLARGTAAENGQNFVQTNVSNCGQELPKVTTNNLSLWDDEGRTDTANAQRLVANHCRVIRHCGPQGRWYGWDGQRWDADSQHQIELRAKETAQRLFGEIAEGAAMADAATVGKAVRFATSSGNSKGIGGMIALARSDERITVEPEQLDASPWFFNVKNGTLDLRTGKLRPHEQDDLITKISPVTHDVDANCPQFYWFLKSILAGQQHLMSYVQRLIGYALTGSTRDHVLPFLYGSGSNGKSTFISTMLALMGDYGMKAPPNLLMAKKDSHPTELADLHGKRFAACVEIDDGRRMAESLVKELTGGDAIRCRRMRENFWQFSPTHKVWMAGNHKPIVRGTDRGIWRRVKLIPFTVTIPDEEQDAGLPDKLLKELPGILNWAIAGCIAWQRDGLGEPEEVKAATAGYRSEMDIVGAFLNECCDLADGAEAPAGELYKLYREWSEKNGERPQNQRSFGRKLTEKDIGTRRGAKGKVIRMGIVIRIQTIGD